MFTVTRPSVSDTDVKFVRTYIQTFLCGDVHDDVAYSVCKVTQNVRDEIKDIAEQLQQLRFRAANITTHCVRQSFESTIQRTEQQLQYTLLSEVLSDEYIRMAINCGAQLYERYLNEHRQIVNDVQHIFNEVFAMNTVCITTPHNLPARIVQQLFTLRNNTYTAHYEGDTTYGPECCKLTVHSSLVTTSQCARRERIQYTKLKQYRNEHLFTMLFFYTLSMQTTLQ